MAFTREEIEAFIEALRTDAELRDRVRDAILDDDFRALPGIMRGLAERLDRLTERVEALTDEVRKLTERMNWAAGQIGNLRGWRFEQAFKDHLAAQIGPRYRKPRLIDVSSDDAVLAAVDSGAMSEEEYEQIAHLDAVVRVRVKGSQEEIILALELSLLVDMADVTRARDRAAILARVFDSEVRPIVAGQGIVQEAEVFARQQGVEVLASRIELVA